MTLDALEDILSATGLPVTYRAWPVGNVPALPYICYLQVGDNNFSADGTVFYSAKRINIELYTAKKDVEAELLVETALTNSGIFFDSEEIYIESEGFYQILYEIEV